MPNDGEGEVRDLLEAHLERYPLLEAVDLYKLLFQAAMGPAHALSDRSSALARLLAELEDPGPGPREPLLDPISRRSGIVRVHLRPWRDSGLDPALLLESFVATSETFRGSLRDLETDCLAAGEHLLREGCSIAGDFVDLLRRVRREGFPLRSHSTAYREAYRPAYRVVEVSLLAQEALTASEADRSREVPDRPAGQPFPDPR